MVQGDDSSKGSEGGGDPPATIGEGTRYSIDCAATGLCVPGQLIIRLNSTQEPELRNFSKSTGIRILEGPYADRVFILETNSDPSAMEASLKQNGIGAISQYNWIGKLQHVPSDQYYLNPYPSQSGTNRAQIGYVDNTFVQAAWDLTATGTKIVAVLDSGVNYYHEDLPRTGSGAVMWDGGASYPYHGWNYYHGNNDPMDESQCLLGHGTRVAGIVAAKHNTLGIAGMAKSNVKIMAVKVVGWNSGLSKCEVIESKVQSGLGFATDHGANVIQMSFCLPLKDPFYHPVTNIILLGLYDAGKLLVGAAGNTAFLCDNGSSTDKVQYPATHSKVLAVSGVNPDNTFWSGSAFGPKVEISAPAEFILAPTVVSNSAYSFDSGTSYAAPHVSGAAAWAWAISPSMTRDSLLSNLKNYAIKVNNQPDRSDQTGYGVVNAYKVAEQIQSDGGSYGDAGASCAAAKAISQAPQTGYGTRGWFDVRSGDTQDYFSFSVGAANSRISFVMTPPQGSDFDLDLRNPSCVSVLGAAKATSNTDILDYNVGSLTGLWYVRVYVYQGSGPYDMTLRTNPSVPFKTSRGPATCQVPLGGPGGIRFDLFEVFTPSSPVAGSTVVTHIRLTNLGAAFALNPDFSEVPNKGVHVGSRINNVTYTDFGFSSTNQFVSVALPQWDIWMYRTYSSAGWWTFWPTIYLQSIGWCSPSSMIVGLKVL